MPHWSKRKRIPRQTRRNSKGQIVSKRSGKKKK